MSHQQFPESACLLFFIKVESCSSCQMELAGCTCCMPKGLSALLCSIWLVKAWIPAGSAPYMRVSAKGNFVWQTYSLNLTSVHWEENLLAILCHDYDVWSVMQQFMQLLCVPLLLYMSVSLITLEALPNIGHN